MARRQLPAAAPAAGLAQAEATKGALDDWGVTDNVVALCYDTTSSNTSRLKGAVVQLETMLERRLLRLECPHYVLELVLGAVSAALFGPTSGPVDTKFQDFKHRWPQLDDTSEIMLLFPRGQVAAGAAGRPHSRATGDAGPSKQEPIPERGL